MTDLMELLRAHDPQRDGAEPPPFERVRSRLDADPPPPAGAGLDVGRRRRSRRALTALAVVIAVAIPVAAITGLDGGRTDIVAAARAAVAPSEGVIVHTVSRMTWTQPDGRPVLGVMQDGHGRAVGTIDGRVERWMTSDPPRWRERRTFPPFGDAPGGTAEQTVDGTVTRTRVSWRSGVVEDRSPLPRPTLPEGAAMAGAMDPVAAVRMLLDQGRLRLAGEATLDGRRVVQLVAETPARAARGGFTPARTTTYFVDAQTYEPVEMRQRENTAPGLRIVFERYERIPLTDETARLLELGGR